MDPQLAIVSIAALAAAVCVGRRALLQFSRTDGEPRGCSGCPAAKTGVSSCEDPDRSPGNPEG